jgi:hypothetical protein
MTLRTGCVPHEQEIARLHPTISPSGTASSSFPAHWSATMFVGDEALAVVLLLVHPAVPMERACDDATRVGCIRVTGSPMSGS